MIEQGKHSILGVYVDAVDCEAAVEKIIDAAKKRMNMTVSALAVHGVMTGVLDSTHRFRLNNLSLIVPDGQPVRWALNWLYRTKLPDRTPGPRLMIEICDRAAKESLPIYLYGSKPDVIADLSRNLKAQFPKLIIAGTQPSKFRNVSPTEKQDIARKIKDSGAAIVFVGLGCPRQEVWVYEYQDILSIPIIAVGAAFDFHAGLLPRAPLWMQQSGLEWFFRLICEPKRLWKRYVLLNPLYLFLLTLQVSKLKKFDPLQANCPEQEILYG